MAHRIARLLFVAGALSFPLIIASCSSIQLGAANLIENGDAPSTEFTYGEGPRQQYDLYRPVGPAAAPPAGPLPGVIFVHGGSWATGDKRSYRWVGQGLAAQGFIAVLPNYGLMPDRRFPGFVDDVARAVAHALAQIPQWGGDPQRVVLMGHSAGAHIAALVAYDARYLAAHGLTPSVFSGFVGLSGPYDFIFDTPLLQRTFSGTPEQERDAMPIHFATRQSPRTLLVMGRDDRTVNPSNTHSLAARFGELGANFDTLWVDGAHGVSVGAFARINRGDSEVVERVRGFVLAPDTVVTPAPHPESSSR
jgi:acetyl esterase/lipase